ncbi:MAG: hypothetical protein DRO09_00060 [Thermoprotei archaeon]|nr:MAG: hypothetical protein DRO09_00060 [Thermoprotei archaeon]
MSEEEEYLEEEEDYEDWWEEEEDEVCPEGYSLEEDCAPYLRLGIETCELLCPWDRIKQCLESETCWICGDKIKKGQMLCDGCWKEVKVEIGEESFLDKVKSFFKRLLRWRK